MQGILINGQFPGPQIDAVTNDNIVINVFNNLPAPFLLSWYYCNFSSPSSVSLSCLFIPSEAYSRMCTCISLLAACCIRAGMHISCRSVPFRGWSRS